MEKLPPPPLLLLNSPFRVSAFPSRIYWNFDVIGEESSFSCCGRYCMCTLSALFVRQPELVELWESLLIGYIRYSMSIIWSIASGWKPGVACKYRLYERGERLGGFKCTCPRRGSASVGIREFPKGGCFIMLMLVLGVESDTVYAVFPRN